MLGDNNYHTQIYNWGYRLSVSSFIRLKAVINPVAGDDLHVMSNTPCKRAVASFRSLFDTKHRVHSSRYSS